MKKISMIWFASAFFAAFSELMLFTVFAACPPPAMKCVVTTYVIAVLFGIAGVLSAGVALVSYKGDIRKTMAVNFSVAAILHAVAAAIMPTGLGGCMKAEMRCHIYTFPYTYVASAIFIVLHIVALIGFLKVNSKS